MSALKSADDFPKEGEALNTTKTGKLKALFLLGGVACLILFALLAITGGGEEGETLTRRGVMAYSWLFAVMFFLTLAVGGIFWTLVHNATNSGWGIMVRRLMENLGSLTPWILLLGLPLVFCSDFKSALWEWIPEQAELREGAAKYADEHLDAEKASRLKEFKSAEVALKKLETETATALAKAGGNKGEANFLQERLDQVKAEFDMLIEDPSESDVRNDLEIHFMKHGDGSENHGNVLLYHKSGYLNIVSWVIRYILYVLILGGIAYVLRRLSVAQDKSGDPKYTRWLRRTSCGFIFFFGVSWTFLVVDWLMVLDYSWFSTMWGVYLFAGAAVSSMAFLVALLTYLRSLGHFKDTVTMEHYHLMGKLMHSFVIFWAYIAFSQFFLIWYANITEETKFYLLRNSDFFNTYTISLLVIGHFFIPFAALLIRQVKKTPKLMVVIAGWLLLMQIADIYWIIIPERGVSLTGGEQLTIPGAVWYDLLAFLAVGGIFGYLLLRSLGKSSLYPSRDPRLEESLNVVN
ncbi:MAG: hypothetical protein GXP30_12900 [Verrucomicrobia bacterium]|nr:hypothetical protein [Verrucomicrobiota bacterium]